MKTTTAILAAASTLTVAFATPALAAPGDPIVLGEDISFDLQVATRLRYEVVDQANQPNDAEAVTFRARVGGELTFYGFTLLAEAEGTGALVNNYNDTLPFNGVEPYPVVADPENIELNRAQLSFMDNGTGMTIGRQRINLGNQRFVGSVGWRQNEQTFDALRGQLKTGPFSLDAALAVSQRTIFGTDSPNSHFNGNLLMLNAGLDLAAVDATAFAYRLDYNTRHAFSSNTYGLTASTALPLGGGTSITASATYATQSDAGENPVSYRAEYWQAELGTTLAGFGLSIAYEVLGSDGGVAAFQTPLATGHAFQGWADLFLTTPANGVRDIYGTVRRQIAVPGLGNVTAAVSYHQFDSDFGGIDYGSEWDASLGFRVGTVNLLAKYANYNADGFGVNTEKFWLQAEWGF
jgi:hypothetical protein